MVQRASQCSPAARLIPVSLQLEARAHSKKQRTHAQSDRRTRRACFDSKGTREGRYSAFVSFT